MRTFAGLFVGGTVAIVVLKAMAAIALPLLGALFGIMVTAFKVMLVVAVAYFVYTFVVKRRRQASEDG